MAPDERNQDFIRLINEEFQPTEQTESALSDTQRPSVSTVMPGIPIHGHARAPLLRQDDDDVSGEYAIHGHRRKIVIAIVVSMMCAVAIWMAVRAYLSISLPSVSPATPVQNQALTRQTNESVISDKQKQEIPIEPLSQSTILGIVRSHAGALQLCVQQAHEAQHLPVGTYRPTLDFVIIPEGRVRDVFINGFEKAQNTQVVDCMMADIKAWVFPASTTTTPIVRFPIGPWSVP